MDRGLSKKLGNYRGCKMNFNLFGFDLFWQDRLYGFWFCGIKTTNLHRHLFSIYYSDGELIIDVLFIRVW